MNVGHVLFANYYHHHISVTELGHLLTRSGLIIGEKITVNSIGVARTGRRLIYKTG
jgi:hypothetical protein